MKRFAAVLFFFIAFLYNGYARADAAAAVVLEAQTGRVLYAVNETQTLPMASTTKIMTALVALENADLFAKGRTINLGANALRPDACQRQ